jgi:hypothetical protein
MMSSIAVAAQSREGHELARYMHVPNCAWTATLASWEGADGETQV